MQAEAAHQKSKYENLNTAYTNKKTSKEDTLNIADSSDSNFSSRSESNNYSTKYGKKKTLITYNSGSTDDDKISSISISRYDFIIDKSATNSKSKLKEHKLSSNNLDASLHDA